MFDSIMALAVMWLVVCAISACGERSDTRVDVPPDKRDDLLKSARWFNKKQ